MPASRSSSSAVRTSSRNSCCAKAKGATPTIRSIGASLTRRVRLISRRIVWAGADLATYPGEAVSLASATFNDAGVLGSHTAAIDWGDGTPVEAGTVNEELGFGTVGRLACLCGRGRVLRLCHRHRRRRSRRFGHADGHCCPPLGRGRDRRGLVRSGDSRGQPHRPTAQHHTGRASDVRRPYRRPRHSAELRAAVRSAVDRAATGLDPRGCER